jgi:SAM-dependent methyltransferase
MKKLIQFAVRKIPRPLLIKLSLLLRKPVSLFYKGTNHKCPVCEKEFRKFLPYGNKGSENRLCPNCLTLERHRLLWLYFNNKTNIFTSDIKMLHIAPEQPFINRFRNSKNINYLTADLVSPLADVKTDIRNMVFENDIFDVVICNHVLEHIDDDNKAMKEILRVLKNGGYAILQVPIDYSINRTYEDFTISSPKEREIHFGQYDHVRVYGKDYSERLRNAGFDVLEDKYIESFSSQEIEKYRLDKNEIIYLCKKS